MQCSRCREEAVLTQRYAGVSLCPRHLALDIEAKAKREIRKNGRIGKNERIYLPAGEAAAAYAVRRFLTELLEMRSDVRFVSDPGEATLRVRADCLEDQAERVFYLVCSGTVSDLLRPGPVRELAPFAVIPREEVRIYAGLHGWEESGSPGTPEGSDSPCELAGAVSQFLTRYTADHPSAAYALKGVSDQLPGISRERRNSCSAMTSDV